LADVDAQLRAAREQAMKSPQLEGYAYATNVAGDLVGQVAEETVTWSNGLTFVLFRPYGLTNAVKGRAEGLALGDGYRVGWGYDQFGRLNPVAWTNVGSALRATTYSYFPNSDLLAVGLWEWGSPCS